MSSADHNLLFGALGLERGFVTRDQLVAAFRDWVQAKAKPLGEFLLAQHSIGPDELALLSAIADEHLRQCNGDTEKSLAAVHLSEATRQELERLTDADLTASLT